MSNENQNTSLTHFLKAFDEADRMLKFALEHPEEFEESTITGLINLLEAAQRVQGKLNTFEKRIRPVVADLYPCELGKSTTINPEASPFKISINRPLSYEANDDLENIKAELDNVVLFNSLFPAKRSFSKTNFNKLSAEDRGEALDYLTEKPGSIACKVKMV